MTKKSSTPAIRFKGFTATWEQRKAKELFVSTEDKGYPELPVLSATQDRGMIRRDENSINIFHDKKNEAGYKRVLPGQFVIHLRSFQGGFAHSAIEGITSPAYAVFGFSEPEKHDSEYWKYVFTSKSFIRRLETVTYGIRDGRSISYEEFLTLGFVYPSKAEQTAIARYLDKLSDLITLHQRKYDKLTNVKKSMLEKMFPKNGSNVPEIRFKGFTEAWEQRKLGELGTITTGNTPSTSIPDYYSDDGIVWVTPTDICENITFESARKLSDLGQQVGRVVPKNTILVTCIASIGKNTMLGNTGSFNQQINGLTPNENKYDPYFLLTESALWSAKMKGSAAAGTMQIVNRTEFSELKTWLPSLIEQQAIGAFFKQLDHLITLHQRELEKLKNLKKACLEKMFV